MRVLRFETAQRNAGAAPPRRTDGDAEQATHAIIVSSPEVHDLSLPEVLWLSLVTRSTAAAMRDHSSMSSVR